MRPVALRRRGTLPLSVLAALALVASMLVAAAAPAAAVEIEGGARNGARPNSATGLSACVGDALTEAAFSDVAGDHVYRDAINCLAYYRITLGTGDGTYEPGELVRRWHMVAFIGRAAALADVEPREVLGDFAEWGSDPVTRAETAMLLVRLVAAAAPDVVQIDAADYNSVTYGPSGTSLTSGRRGTLDYFADSRAEMPRSVDNLITAAYELGIARGTGDGSAYEPEKPVTRGEMAAFITRALAHTTVRPAGVSGQADDGRLYVSLRDGDFRPVDNADIDVFSIDADAAGEAFGEDGSCTDEPDPHPAGGYVCEIDGTDFLTDADGDVSLDVSGNEDRTYWAWTGETGDELDAGTERAEVVVRQAIQSPNRAMVSSDRLRGAKKVRFGSPVTLTVQLQYAEDEQDPDPVDVGPGTHAYDYEVTISIYSSGTCAKLGALELCNVAPTWPLWGRTLETISVDDDGAATFVVTVEDPRPDPGDDDDRWFAQWEVRPSAENMVELPVGQTALDAETPLAPLGTPAQFFHEFRGSQSSVSGLLQFDDDEGEVARLSLVEGIDPLIHAYEYSDPDGAVATVVAGGINQYGDPVPLLPVKVTTTAGSEYTCRRQWYTNRLGLLPIRHHQKDSCETERQSPGSETLKVTWPGPDGEYGTTDDLDSATETGLIYNTTLYWLAHDSEALESSSGLPGGTGKILSGDVHDDVIVVDMGDGIGPVKMYYDSNDRYDLDGAAATMEEFEKELARLLGSVGFNRALHGTSGTLEWRGYRPRSSRTITAWDLEITGL